MTENAKTYRHVGRNLLSIPQDDKVLEVEPGSTFTAVLSPVMETQLIAGGHILLEGGSDAASVGALPPAVLGVATEEDSPAKSKKWGER